MSLLDFEDTGSGLNSETFAYLQCNTAFSLWGVTASSSTVPLHFLMAKKKFQIFWGVRGWPFLFRWRILLER